MPRITVSRVIGLIPLIWFTLSAVWYFLPSPLVPESTRNGQIQRVLRLERVLTTVVKFDDSFKAEERGNGVLCTDCGNEGLVLDWQLEVHHTSNSLLLHLGEARVNLTDAAVRGAASALAEKGHFVSESVMARVCAGYPDSAISMPWFPWADRIILYWSVPRPRENIHFRIYSPASGVVEVWKDIDMWKALAPEMAPTKEDRDTGLLARFSGIRIEQTSGSRSDAAMITVTDLQGGLPSKTWFIRSLISVSPLSDITFFPVSFISSFTFGIVPFWTVHFSLMLAVVVGFVRAERVNLPITRWLCRDRKKRPRGRGIWGPSGPVPDEENSLLSGRPYASLSMFPNAVSKPSKSRPRVFDKT